MSEPTDDSDRQNRRVAPAVGTLGTPLAESIASYDNNVGAYIERFSDIDFSSLRDLAFNATDTPPRRLVDIGCGTGRDVKAFSKVAETVVGIDLSRGLLAAARRTAPSVKYIHADMRRLPIAHSSIDLVWSMASLVHLSDDEVIDALCEARRVLIPNGIFFASVPFGSGHEWREDGLGGRRWFNYFMPARLNQVASECGFIVDQCEIGAGKVQGKWISMLARVP